MKEVIFMYNQIERELKILISEDQYNTILHSYEFSEKFIQTNTFYDTPDRKVRAANGAMRIRKKDGKHIFTLKIRTDPITHIEYEKEIDVDRIQDIRDPEILGWLNKYGIPQDVEKILSFTTERSVLILENAEFCVDKTIFENYVDYELEYEYTKEHDGITAFNAILAPYGLHYIKNNPGKFSRAMKLKLIK